MSVADIGAIQIAIIISCAGAGAGAVACYVVQQQEVKTWTDVHTN